MNILLVNRHIPPEYDSSIIQTMTALALELQAAGHEVHLLGLSEDSRAPETSLWKGLHIHRIYLPPSANIIKWNIDFNRRTTALFTRLNRLYHFDAVNIHESRLPYSLLGRLKKKHKQVKTVFTFHASAAWEYSYDNRHLLRRSLTRPVRFLKTLLRFVPNYLWLRHAERRALERCDLVHVASHFVAGQVSRHIDTGSKVIKIPFGCDYSRFSRRNVDPGALTRIKKTWPNVRLFTVRRLEPRMGLETLIDAMALLEKEYPGTFHLSIGGRGSLAGTIEEHITALGLKNIYLCGFIPDNELTAWYELADIFVLPTAELEGFGLVLLEAMAMGRVIAGSDAGAIPEVLKGAPGARLFKRENADDLAKVLAAMWNERSLWPAPPVIRSFARERYNWKSYAQQFINSLETVHRP